METIQIRLVYAYNTMKATYNINMAYLPQAPNSKANFVPTATSLCYEANCTHRESNVLTQF